MSTDQEFEREWEQVKCELMKLNGQTVYTIVLCKHNEIVRISQKELHVKTEQTHGDSEPVSWSFIKKQYGILYNSKRLARGDGGRGAFSRALLANLTTAEMCKDGKKTILRYVPEGRPPTLKSGNTPRSRIDRNKNSL